MSKILVLPPIPKEIKKGGGVAVAGLMSEYSFGEFDFVYSGEKSKSNKKSIFAERMEKYIFEKPILGKIPFIITLLLRSIKIGKYFFNKNIVIAHTFWEALCSILLKKLFFQKIKVVHVYHGVGPYYSFITDLNGYKKIESINSFFQNLELYIHRNSEISGFPSHGAASVFNQYSDHNISDYCVFPNTISNEALSHDNSNSEHVSIICVTTLNSDKGADRLIPFINYFSRVLKKDISFKLIGNGPLADKIANQAKDLRNVKLIWEKNPLPNDVIRKELAKSNFYICLHRKSIFDIVIIEAISCGCVPILTNVGGNPEFLPTSLHKILINEKNLCDQKKIEYLIVNFMEIREQLKMHYNKNLSPEAFISRYKNIDKLVYEHL